MWPNIDDSKRMTVIAFLDAIENNDGLILILLDTGTHSDLF